MVLDLQEWILYVSAEVENEDRITTVEVMVTSDAAGANLYLAHSVCLL